MKILAVLVMICFTAIIAAEAGAQSSPDITISSGQSLNLPNFSFYRYRNITIEQGGTLYFSQLGKPDPAPSQFTNVTMFVETLTLNGALNNAGGGYRFPSGAFNISIYTNSLQGSGTIINSGPGTLTITYNTIAPGTVITAPVNQTINRANPSNPNSGIIYLESNYRPQ